MFKLDLSKIFNKLAFDLAQELNSLIRKNTDVDGAGYSPVMRKVKSPKRAGKSIKKYERTGRRLVNTGRFNQKAFIGKFGTGSMSIEGNPDSYDSDVTFNDIIEYNDKNSTALKGKHGSTIKSIGPAIVPRTEKQFFESTETGKSIKSILEVEIMKQVEEEVTRNIVKNLKLKVTL